MKQLLLVLFALSAFLQLNAQQASREVKLSAPSGDLIHFDNWGDVLTFSREEFFAQLPESAEFDKLKQHSWFMPAGDTLSMHNARAFFWRCIPNDKHALGKVIEKCLVNGNVTIYSEEKETYLESVFLFQSLPDDAYEFSVAVDPEDDVTIFWSIDRFYTTGCPSF